MLCILLFPDAEVGEYRVKDVVGGDFASDLAKVVDNTADVLAQQIRG